MRLKTLVLIISTLLLFGCGTGTDPVTQAVTQDTRPNILLIVADDLGYSDLGAFGGEISTPNIDSLATAGVKLSRFYTSLTCSPTRAMLLSGVDSHRSGLGNMTETIADNQLGLPGYEGRLNHQIVTMAELLRDAGYHTYMAGKWHLGVQYDQSPRARGFERSFAPLFGGGSHFDDMVGPDVHRPDLLYRSDGELLPKLPEDFYSSKDFTDRMIEYIDSNLGDGKPFMGYLAYTAPHWPLQVPDDYLEKYRGAYDGGYDVIRAERFKRLKSLGLAAPDMTLPERPASVPAWDTLNDEARRFHARNMEVYAAMVEHMDMSIGRVLDYLAQKDELQNTFVFLISDNGADHWSEDSAPGSIGEYARTFNNEFENRGRKGSFIFYGTEWAHVGATMFKHYKGTTSEGGIRSPAIAAWPGNLASGTTVTTAVSVLDVLPTFLELADTRHPGTNYKGRDVIEPTGHSFKGLLQGKPDDPSVDRSFGVEMWGMQGYIQGDWKIVRMRAPIGNGDWQLYNVVNDPAETRDLASTNTAVLKRMVAGWDAYAVANNVVLPEGGLKIRPPGPLPAR